MGHRPSTEFAYVAPIPDPALGRLPVKRYRYRSFVLLGPWRTTRRDALADAVRSGLAVWAGEPWQDVKWRFQGEIEESEDDEQAATGTGGRR